MVMLDRYSQKDKNLKTLKQGDLVITVIREDSSFPTSGIGNIVEIDNVNQICKIKIESDYILGIDNNLLVNNSDDIIEKRLNNVEKPLEIFYEQIALRVANALAKNEGKKLTEFTQKFYEELKNLNIVPAGRVLYGAGSDVMLLSLTVLLCQWLKIQEMVSLNIEKKLWKLCLMVVELELMVQL